MITSDNCPIYKMGSSGCYVLNVNGYPYTVADEDLSGLFSTAEVEAYLAEHPEALVPEPVPEPPSAEEIERQRVAGIMASLAALDARAIRPMRAKLAGSATVQDEETLAEVEEEAEDLRSQL